MTVSPFINVNDFHLDALFNSLCSIWKKGATGVNGYGIESQAFTLLVSDIPCCVQPGDGKELDTDVAFGVQTYTFFMRPILVDDPPIPLNIHHWLQINSSNKGTLVGPPIVSSDLNPDGTMFDILNIKNPMLLDHHLEIQTRLIEP